MSDVKRILCPVDFSETSRHAFRYAALLARQFSAELTAIHVVEDAPLFTAYNGVPEVDFRSEVERSARKEMERLLAAEDLSGLRVATEIIRGTSYKAIAQYAAEHAADMVVIGTHGRSGLEYAFFGSVAERVMKSVSCPVLVVPRAGGKRKRKT